MSINHKKKIFENTAPNPYFNTIESPQVPKILEQSIIQQNPYFNSQLGNSNQFELTKQVLDERQSFSPNDLEQFLILFRQPQKINMKLDNSQSSQSNQQQFYEQLEIEGEKLRVKLKADARIVSSIIEKHTKMKSNKQRCIEQMNHLINEIKAYNNVSRYSELNRSIKYNFNQLESNQLELRDIQKEASTFERVMSVSVQQQQSHQQGKNQLDQTIGHSSNETSEAEFTSLSLQIYSSIEMHAKEFEQTISEKKRLMHISQNYHQYKQVCQGLIQLIQKYPQFEQQQSQQMLKLESIASIYFFHFQKELSQQSLHYTQITEDIRLSLSIIDKMKYLLDQAKSLDCITEFYLYIESQLTGQQIIIKSGNNLKLAKAYQKQFNMLNINNYQYFHILRHKVYNKCLLEFDKIQFDIKTARNLQSVLLDYVKRFKNYISIDYIKLFNEVLVKLQQDLKKESWLYLINLYTELSSKKQDLLTIIKHLQNIKHQNQYLTRLISVFQQNIEKELEQIKDLQPKLNQYLQIQDFKAQKEFENFYDQYLKCYNEIHPKQQSILTDINQFLEDSINPQLNDEQYQYLRSLQTLQPSIRSLSNKRISGNFKEIKTQFDELLQFEVDIVQLQISMKSIITTNFNLILDDFLDITKSNTNSVLSQLMEFIQKNIKIISEIKSPSLYNIKEQQLRQFQWVWIFFEQFEKFRSSLSLLFNNNQTINYSQYLQFMNKNKFSSLFYQLSKCNYKICKKWHDFQLDLSHISLKSYIQYITKLHDKIIIIGQFDVPLTQIQFNEENCQLLLEFLELDNTSQLQRFICKYQIYRKMKQLQLNQVTFNKLKQYFEHLQIEQDNEDFIDLRNILIECSDSQQKDSEIYSTLQEEWILDHLEKGDTSFIQGFVNQEGIFSSNLMRNTAKLQRLAKLSNEQNLNWRNIKQILKQEI
ncbi:unnamed protein product (macronuclear) [Paramecium tetraurelia]|uniref:Uncharacterized protein n=1 Tax=Paramecium tetraurelia TaxID=5888 RepID=A0BYD2_PARTE|nr:uncharacterized protein GSPATT00033402001 [Paramecium tetraurelia]CAK63549.1 unnamed protein product [Paramecium tetraurelia]|eukprot:XP_001430947.1 hypothetical protein (macronuclear) [Paramecium tetraurelia strain d4-2]